MKTPEQMAAEVDRAKEVADKDEKQNDKATFDRLAKLSRVEYDRVRKAEADALQIRASTLDAEVEKRRPEQETDASGKAVEFETVTPWPESIDGDALLNELSVFIRKYLFVPDRELIAIVLWIVFTYLHGMAVISPILAVTSPQKRCGKTTLLSLLTLLCHRALPTNNITAAALFRTVEKYAPTLLIDEADTFLAGKDNDELRGVVNSGHTRQTAFVIRTTGDAHEPTKFTTWAAKSIALIGKLPDTIQDRSIEVRLGRKKTGEKVDRLRVKTTAVTIRRKILRWTMDHAEHFEAAEPVTPEKLHDRAKDNWEPLLAIADLVGDDWPLNTRKAAEVLTAVDDDSAEVLLLEDCRRLFNVRDYYRPGDLHDELLKLEGRPWAEWSRGKPIAKRKVGLMLSAFDIHSHTKRDGDFSGRAYWKESFLEAFSRYLPHPPNTSGTTAQVNNGAGFSENTSGTNAPTVPDRKSPKRSTGAGCAVVPDRKGGTGQKEQKTDQEQEIRSFMERLGEKDIDTAIASIRDDPKKWAGFLRQARDTTTTRYGREFSKEAE